MAFRERYVTEGLNQKMAVNTPPGVYRGFRLQANAGTNNSVTIKADPTYLDHAAVYQTDDGFSLSVHNTGGDFNVDLTSLVDTVDVTLVIAIVADYAIGATTTATVEAYTLSPVDELTGATEENEIVILGTVVIPANSVAPIPSGNVTPDRFQPAAAAVATGARAWVPLLKNGGFEQGDETTQNDLIDRQIPHWRTYGTASMSPGVATDKSDPRTGIRALALKADATFTTNKGLHQLCEYPADPGTYVHWRFFRKIVQPTTLGQIEFRISFLSEAGGEGTPLIVPIVDTGSSADADYVEVSGTTQVPAPRYGVKKVQFHYNGAEQSGTPGTVVFIDDVQVWVEDAADRPGLRRREPDGDAYHTSLVLRDGTSTSAAPWDQPACVFDYDVDANELSLQKSDGTGAAGLDTLFFPGTTSINQSKTFLEMSSETPLYLLMHHRSTGTDEHWIVKNAELAGLNWSQINTSYDSLGMQWVAKSDADSNGSYIEFVRQISGTGGTWIDSGYESPSARIQFTTESDITNRNKIKGLNLTEDGGLTWTIGVASSTVGNPDSTTAVRNSLRAKNTLKAWAYISTDGGGGASVVEGFNITSAAISGSNVVVTWARAFASSSYAAVFTRSSASGSSFGMMRTIGRGTTGLTVSMSSELGSTINMGTTITNFYLMVHAEMA